MRNSIYYIVAGAMLLATFPTTGFAFDEPPEPAETTDVLEATASETTVQPQMPVEAVPPAVVVESPGVVAYPLPSENLDVPPEPDPGEAWRTRRGGADTEPDVAPVEERFCPDDTGPAFTSRIKRSPVELGVHGTFIPKEFPAADVAPAPPRCAPITPFATIAPYAPVSPYPADFAPGHTDVGALAPAGTLTVEETPETSSYIALKQQYEVVWKEKIEAALAFVPGVRVSVNVEAGDHTGSITRVVRINHHHGHEAGVQRTEQVFREINRPVVTGVCILLPVSDVGRSYHGAGFLHHEKIDSEITLVMHGGHETLLAYEPQVREIVAALLPPGSDAKVIVSHYHPAPVAPAAATPLATAAADPTVNAGFYLLAGIALCALTTIAVAGGIRISRLQPPPVADATTEAGTPSVRRAA